MWDRHRRRRLRNWLVGLAGPAIVRLWTGSLRVRFLADLPVSGGFFEAPRGIYMIWHQRLLTYGGFFRGFDGYALISEHADGEMLARLLRGLRIRTIRGSTTRGGARAVREFLKHEGTARLAVTPDGPQGPAFVLQPGTVYLASRAGLALYPCLASFRHAWKLPTWDRFLLPWPFTRALLRVGPAIAVPPELGRDELEEWRRRIEGRFRELTEETDARFEELYGRAVKIRGARYG